jgi:hypothetical protein
MEEEPFPEQEGASVEGKSQDVRNEARKNAGSDFWYPEGSPIPYLPHGDCLAVPSLCSI